MAAAARASPPLIGSLFPRIYQMTWAFKFYMSFDAPDSQIICHQTKPDMPPASASNIYAMRGTDKSAAILSYCQITTPAPHPQTGCIKSNLEHLLYFCILYVGSYTVCIPSEGRYSISKCLPQGLELQSDCATVHPFIYLGFRLQSAITAAFQLDGGCFTAKYLFCLPARLSELLKRDWREKTRSEALIMIPVRHHHASHLKLAPPSFQRTIPPCLP